MLNNPSYQSATHLDSEEVPSSLAVAGREDGCVDVDKMSLLEEFMDGHGGRVTDPEESREGTGAGSQVGELPCVLQTMSCTGFERVLLSSVCV